MASASSNGQNDVQGSRYMNCWNYLTYLSLPLVWLVALGSVDTLQAADAASQFRLQWAEAAPIPNELGVAGPVVGLHNGGLIVAGGANFPRPVWETSKVWHDDIYVLPDAEKEGASWQRVGQLPRPLGYAACVSLERGILVMGGNDAQQVFDDVLLVEWSGDKVAVTAYPKLPRPCVHGQATVVGNHVYLAGGQSGPSLDSAMSNFWRMELKENPSDCVWEALPDCPAPARALNLTVSQHNGFYECVYVISGRAEVDGEVRFLTDMWEYTPDTNSWRSRCELPSCVMAGSGIDLGANHILVLGGDDGSLFARADDLKDNHPGFTKSTWAYHTITDRWTSAGASSANLVTTHAVRLGGQMLIPSGEIRPRVRSPKVWRVTVLPAENSFGILNYTVLFGYLAAMVGVGLFFARRNRTTDDYFRGGMHIPWWAAGCSIYATMLSSLTYTGIPSKAFQQDWVASIGNFTIPIVAGVAVFVALPFYRRINATSAYEYLERRFNRSVRLFGSASFALFHVFRMAVVLALTALTLDIATPLSPAQCVLLMGVLSIIYCTLGGIEAVIWTDTLQTVVLLGGALIAVVWILSGIDGGFQGMLTEAGKDNKFKWAHFNLDATSAQVAIWFMVVGGMAQNFSSYTADQAVVQRYMTTATERLAARSIWTNAIMVIPTTFLFFGIGTALFAFYRSQPHRLDPTVAADQIFPLFISRELPAGLAGLIVAGVFAAAQSTVSTSMNSISTTIVTDFIRPLGLIRDEHGYLRIAQLLTMLFGVAGTLAGLSFINPDIRSLFDEFIKVIGLFMGVLGGLFILGALTCRANAFGAMIGGLSGAAVMFLLWKYTEVTGYLYTFCGITSCVIIGYGISLLSGSKSNDDLAGLTIYTLESRSE